MIPPHDLSYSKWIFILGSIGLLIFLLNYASISPEHAYHQSITKEQAIAIGQETMQRAGFDPKEFFVITSLSYNDELLASLQMKNERRDISEEFIERDGIYWTVKFEHQSRSSTVVRMNTVRSEGDPKDYSINIRIGSKGNIMRMVASIPDSLRSGSFSESEAFAYARTFVQPRFNGTLDSLIASEKNMKSHYTEYSFRLGATSSLRDRGEVIVTIVGNRIASSQFMASAAPSDVLKEHLEGNQIQKLIALLMYLITGVMMIGTLFRRLKNDEFSFRTSFLLTAILAVISTVSYIHILPDLVPDISWLIVVVVLFSVIGRALPFFLSWSATEGSGRAAWNHKFATIDAVLKMKFRSRWIGMSFVHGVFLGWMLLGAIALVVMIGDRFTPTIMLLATDFGDTAGVAGALETVWKNLGYGLDYIIVGFAVVFTLSVYIPSLFWKYSKNSLMIALIGGMCWLISGQVLNLKLFPITTSSLAAFVMGFLLTYSFLKSDLLTVSIATISFVLTKYALVSFHLDSGSFAVLSGCYTAVLVGFIGFGVVLSRIRTNEIDLIDYSPNFVKRMNERQRLLLEVESARHIQLSLLPKEKPSMLQLDIASSCIPASEVGGDYYDFIRLDQQQLGILIGDVSGKGISAAFYMTLAKGVIASQAKRTTSPKSVLCNVNELLYEIMERGKFISMVYGIFDVKRNVLTFAHAGHNPIFHVNAKTKEIAILRSKGMALGLEKGILFADNLEEAEIRLEPDDIFVFYTDGYVEAMNRHQEEFSEARLLAALRAHLDSPAEQLLTNINETVKSFVGKAVQHDDMTMVIVRVAALRKIVDPTNL